MLTILAWTRLQMLRQPVYATVQLALRVDNKSPILAVARLAFGSTSLCLRTSPI